MMLYINKLAKTFDAVLEKKIVILYIYYLLKYHNFNVVNIQRFLLSKIHVVNLKIWIITNSEQIN